MAHVKTAISIEESLFKEAEALAEKLGTSRSRLFSRAVEDFVRQRENEELLERLNAAHADGLGEEEQEHLDRIWAYQRRLLEETGNEW
jgi:antitoxin MazE6